MVYFVLVFEFTCGCCVLNLSSEQRKLLLAPVILHVPLQSGSYSLYGYFCVDACKLMVLQQFCMTGKKMSAVKLCAVNYLFCMPMGCAPEGVSKAVSWMKDDPYNWTSSLLEIVPCNPDGKLIFVNCNQL